MHLAPHPFQALCAAYRGARTHVLQKAYHRTQDHSRGRRFVDGGGAQSMPTAFQTVAFPNTVDLDTQNAMPTIALQVLHRVGLKDMDLFAPEVGALYQVVDVRPGFCATVLRMPESLAKPIVLSTL